VLRHIADHPARQLDGLLAWNCHLPVIERTVAA
jgi:hypothetical protein